MISKREYSHFSDTDTIDLKSCDTVTHACMGMMILGLQKMGYQKDSWYAMRTLVLSTGDMSKATTLGSWSPKNLWNCFKP